MTENAWKITAAKGLVKGDLTAGVMVSVAIIAAIIIGEHSAAALVAFMMMFGELLENLAMARSDDALKELASLVPSRVTLLDYFGEAQRAWQASASELAHQDRKCDPCAKHCGKSVPATIHAKRCDVGTTCPGGASHWFGATGGHW